MAYPVEDSDRVQFWTNQIAFARTRVKPLFDACEVLIRQYFNEASTTREASARVDLEEQVRRTKAGLIYGWIDQSLANMLDRLPVFRCTPENDMAFSSVEPENPNSPTMAQGSARIVNYRYRATNQLRVDERCALDAFLYPFGVVKIGYTPDLDLVAQELLQEESGLPEFESADEENMFLDTGQRVLIRDAHDHLVHLEAHKARMKQLKRDRASSGVLRVYGEHIELHNKLYDRPEPSENTNVRREASFAVRWRPDMFLTNWGCLEGPEDARWLAFGFEVPLEEFEANPLYKNVEKFTTTRMDGAPEKPEGLDGSDGFDMIRGWEVWARNFPVSPGVFRDLWFTLVEGAEAFPHYEEEWPYDRLDNYPAEVLVFQPGLDNWFAKPPLLMGGGDTVQALTNELMDSFLSTIRKQKNIWLVDPRAGIDPKVVSDILDAPDGSVIEVPGLSELKGQAIMALPFLEISSDKTSLMSLLQQMFDRSVGTPQPVQLPKTDTATEASIMEKRNTSRENRRSALLTEFQVRKARKMFQLDCQFQPEDLVLIDPNAKKFIQMTPDMAKGEYLMSLDVTSSSTSVAVERSQWMDLLNLFAGLTPVMIQNFGMPPNLPELAKRLLVRGFNDRAVEEILPMLDQASKQLQGGEMPLPGMGGPNGQAFGGMNSQEGLTPEAAAAMEAVVAGRNAGDGVGPLKPEAFQRGVRSEGQQLSEGNTI